MRGFAIVLMVVYHVGYDIHMLAPQVDLDPFNGAWRALQVVCASVFLALVGVSYWVADRRGQSRGLHGVALWRMHARRGGVVLAAAILVSLVTLVALGEQDAVRYGILHLIATAMLVVLPITVRLGAWNAALGACVVIVGLLIKDTSSDVPGVMVLGLDPGETGVDWYPLFPWMGLCLIGVAIGTQLYPDGQRGRWLRRLAPEPRGAGAAGAPGRHSLPIYLVHQPVLVALTGAVLALTGTEFEWP